MTSRRRLSWRFESGSSRMICPSPVTKRLMRFSIKCSPPMRCIRRITTGFTCGIARNPSGHSSRPARGGQAGPSIAHLWHMPGHIYSRLKRYGDAVWQQEASSRADHAHMMRDRVMPDQIHNYAHNQEWMTRNLIHVGRSRDALTIAKNLVEHPRHPKYNTVARKGRSASYGRTRLFQVLERFEMWDELIDLCETMYLEPTDLNSEQDKRIHATWRRSL